jgi:hypothetical protein
MIGSHFLYIGDEQIYQTKGQNQMTKMTPAIRRALAYIHITGRKPRGIQMDTRLALYDFCEDGDSLLTYKVKPEFVAAVEGHALVKAHRSMIENGFTLAQTWNRGRDRLSRGIRYLHDGDDLNRDGAIHSFRTNDAGTYDRWTQVGSFTSDRM